MISLLLLHNSQQISNPIIILRQSVAMVSALSYYPSKVLKTLFHILVHDICCNDFLNWISLVISKNGSCQKKKDLPIMPDSTFVHFCYEQ